MSQSKKLALHLIEKIIAHSQSHYKKNDLPVFQKFIQLFFYNVSLDDLQSRAIEDLYGAVLSQWMLTKKREPGAVILQVYNPSKEKEGWQSPHTIIQVGIDDMPFIIDSLAMELNQLNLYSHLMIHTGGTRMIHDKSGKIIDVLPYGPKETGSVFEAPVYIEIDRQSDPQSLEMIYTHLMRVLDDVKAIVVDWPLMQEKVRNTLLDIDQAKLPIDEEELEEAKAFLEWLLNDHFTFLGYREYSMIKRPEGLALKLTKGSSLGVLRDDSASKVYRSVADLPAEAQAIALDKNQLLIISKTNTRSTVHRPTYTDYIGVKRFNQKGEIIGEVKFIGLFTSSAYSSNPRYIPFLRRKVTEITRRAGFPERSHSGKDLMHILATLPRDDLFHSNVDELHEIVMQILQLQERRRIRLIARKDAYGRFMSCLVYIPRENFNTELLSQMQDILVQAFNGLEVTFSTHFSESILAVIHYVVRIDPKQVNDFDLNQIEKNIIAVAQSWQDGFRDVMIEKFGEESANLLITKYRRAFPASYRELFTPRSAVFDVEKLEALSESVPLQMSFYRSVSDETALHFKLFNDRGTIPLSDAIPMLENMGLRVIGEQPHIITLLKMQKSYWINEFRMSYPHSDSLDIASVQNKFQEAFYRVWRGEAENDGFNKLVLAANLDWHEVTLLRAYAKYLRQIGLTFSQQYIEEALLQNVKISHYLIELFTLRFDPKLSDSERVQFSVVHEKIIQELDNVASLDHDRILRFYVALIQATLRTNYFQLDAIGQSKSFLSFKLASHLIPEVPKPIPLLEAFIYAPRFEGVHLRMAKVARGGIRWSDRQEDFRTEVLGLMKAQQVKNALIVPAGAKGGFVTKALPKNASRDEIQQEGIACYQNFVRGLLDLVDNVVNGEVLTPASTVCYDEQDTYLVVAADKGTATFSDIANGISAEYGFWLSDAFASGGSAGYDHKKMAITARGAWVSVACHFQGLGIDVDNTEITAIGIGDMSGDVFGNGLLLSKKIKLVAAFNHMHIFLDPNPDTATSYEERQRLFNLPRSTWADYNTALISRGGGIYNRQMKSIKLSPEVRRLLGVDDEVVEPNQLLRFILKAPVDLLWNGGIGTYVKAVTELNAQVGDRSNDLIRINGNELRARVVGEGGNLGFTQLGRIEYQLNGGRINTDFIDNSGGVDCSDHEVNIKILLNPLVHAERLSLRRRNQLLEEMSDEVAALVLSDNYSQNKAITLEETRTKTSLNLFERYLDSMERDGKIDRTLEFLPTTKELQERRAQGQGFTRPELAVLLSYSKNILKDEILKTDLVDEPYLADYIEGAFPSLLQKKYREEMDTHHLRTDIIATQLSNLIVAEMGMTFCYQMQDETGASFGAIVRAYIVAKKIFMMDAIMAQINALDNQINSDVQQQMILDLIRLVRRGARWFLRNRRARIDMEATVTEFLKLVQQLSKKFPQLLMGGDKLQVLDKLNSLMVDEVPEAVATQIAYTGPMFHALNIVQSSMDQGISLQQVAKVYFTLEDQLELIWFRNLLNDYPVVDRWSVLAKASLLGDIDWIQRNLTTAVLSHGADTDHPKTVTHQLELWASQHQALIERWREVLINLRGTKAIDFAILSVAVRELLDLVQTSKQCNAVV